MPKVLRTEEGDVIGGSYVVQGILGVGGFGVVYLVQGQESGAMHALKTLRDEYLRDPGTRELFRREAKVWVALDRHANIVRADFITELSGRLYIGMEYVEPGDDGLSSLAGHLTAHPPDLAQAVRWCIQFCHGMEYARSRGIRCHRDVKPQNIMITREKTVKITDFGFAGCHRTCTSRYGPSHEATVSSAIRLRHTHLHASRAISKRFPVR